LGVIVQKKKKTILFVNSYSFLTQNSLTHLQVQCKT
jgi:hypothetical protein